MVFEGVDGTLTLFSADQLVFNVVFSKCHFQFCRAIIV